MVRKLSVFSCAIFVATVLMGATAFAQTQAAQITSGPAVQNVTPNSATVTWSTNVPASSIVRYGTNANNLDKTAQTSWGGTNHSVQINKLSPGTMYFFQVQSGQALGTGTGALSRLSSFTTPGQQSAQTAAQNANGLSGTPETNIGLVAGPIIQRTQQPNTVNVWWRTNAQSSTILKYGTSPNNLSQQAEQPWGQQSHTVSLTNLQPGATYYYQVETSAGRVLDSGTFQAPSTQQAQQQFHITHGPVIEKLAPTSVVVAWTTNVPASSTVRYGTSPNNLNQTAQAAWGQQTHRVTINNLQPNTKYYFQVQTGQAQGTGEALSSAVFPAMTEAPGQQAMVFNTR